ncbi:MAG: hypothetical protein HYR56_12250 [Acidobacteria bacterium]|nr:hypothetical protein [Acidobacteriota bacterium]MBI3423259.1 hypothetical protein [Acidobacteriota bacterium]
MTTKEMLHGEIEKLSPTQLTKLYAIVKKLAEPVAAMPNATLMARLKQIEIDAPADFSVNFELYLTGAEDDQSHSD